MRKLGTAWPTDPLFWLLVLLAGYGLANVMLLALALAGLARPDPWVANTLIFALPLGVAAALIGHQFLARSRRLPFALFLGMLAVVVLILFVNLSVFYQELFPSPWGRK